MTRRSLALVIPTYRRPAILAAGLARMADALHLYDVALYVSDDSPDLETEHVIADFAANGSSVHYRRNVPSLGHDDNIIASLLWPVEDFVWILGDAGWIEPEGFDRIMQRLDQQDFLFVNSHAPTSEDRAGATGEEARVLIRDLLWHQTLTGATIYSRRVLEWLRNTQLGKRGAFQNFPHLAIILDYAAVSAPCIDWIGTRSTHFASKQSYWQDQALSVFVDDWAAIVRRQSSVITAAERSSVLRSHSSRLGLFHGALLRDLRRTGRLNLRYVRSQPDFFDAMHLPRWKLEAILRLPRRLLAYLDRT
jgi:glycosyltransferase involved in cell wall biosynthesis